MVKENQDLKERISQLLQTPKGKIAAVCLGLVIVAGVFLAVPAFAGRQVAVSFTNKITQAPLANVKVTVNGASATTNNKGVATVALATDKQKLTAAVKVDGYNDTTTDVTVTDKADANKVSVTPAGKISYLSKQTGKINVVSANLDGTGAKTLVTGTGSEQENANALLSSRDWKYLALQSKRDSSKKEEGQLYVVDANSGQLKTVASSDDEVQLVGWVQHKFIFLVTKVLPLWQPGHYALKSYDADSGKVATLETTGAHGTSEWDSQYETIPAAHIISNKVIYVKNWTLGGLFATTANNTKASVTSVDADGSGKKTLKEFAFSKSNNIGTSVYTPKEVYFKVATDSQEPQYYEYDDGNFESTKNENNAFEAEYPTFLISPSDKKTFWFELKDGQNKLYVGDDEGAHKKALANIPGFSPYGWYGDDYVLLSKGNNELYIASADKLSDQNPPLKAADYYKAALTFPSYGSGYGGI